MSRDLDMLPPLSEAVSPCVKSGVGSHLSISVPCR